MKYDYIIAGAGCAGLSLLTRILKEPELRDKKILVIDKDKKQNNDRTWSFWERGEGLFEPIVRHSWKTLIFKTESFVNEFKLKEYAYKMIRGIDFYKHVFRYCEPFDNVEFRFEEISGFEVKADKAILQTEKDSYQADYLFNSTGLMNPAFSQEDTLLQHFMGWEIETKAGSFDPSVGTLMDFSLSQQHGTTFMYFLPVSDSRALVEYTLFSPALLSKSAYQLELERYIEHDLGIKEYDIVDKEFGVIPMALKKFTPHIKNRIINLGTAGGHTKASSGYTFQFIQKYTHKITQQLKRGESPVYKFTYRDKMFQWYDRTLLEVMLSKSMTGKSIFSQMFQKIPPERILKFLGNESTVMEDIGIMLSVPINKFLPAGIKQMVQ